MLGATIAMAAPNLRPPANLLAWLGVATEQAGGPVGSAGAAGGAGASRTEASAAPFPIAASASALTLSAAPATGAPVASAQPAAPAGTPAATGASASPAATLTASGGPGPSLAIGTGSLARPVYHGSRLKKVVALTFDDGFNPVALRQILAILKREHVTATFFPYGWAVHRNSSGWHKVAAAGYPIGNHTLSHAILSALTPAQVTDQMVRGRHTIDLYSGAASVNLMRPPGGKFTAATERAIAMAGYDTMVLWDIDTADWKGFSAATIRARAIRGTNGSIVLMHAGPLNTPKALPGIIANYRARGFTFVTVPELLAAR